MRVLMVRCFVLLAALSLVCAASCGDDEDAGKLKVHNYKNPFTYEDGTTIVVEYGAAGGETGTLEFYLYIYDMNGLPVVVQRMTRDSVTAAPFEIAWNAANERGQKLAPGVYLLKVTTVNFRGGLASYTATHKMMVQ